MKKYICVCVNIYDIYDICISMHALLQTWRCTYAISFKLSCIYHPKNAYNNDNNNN